ncbi:Radical SAM superfamily enzyme, MoaA/NifB/PqqE/SkfB family [Burkholderia sp. YR290]|nr:Radical SAM superfamily enzyme, MoaA/NifB/PqqE/SkfB family [Burkholderia sp. YR290]
MTTACEERPDSSSGTLMLHLLGRCNLRCAHCYMDGAPERQELLPVELVISAIRESRKLGVGVIYLTGGEPFLYKQLDRVLNVASTETDARIVVCTNATLINPERARMLSDARASVNISVDGAREFHNSFRGQPGAFERTENGIVCLRQLGVPVTIATTVTQENRHYLPSLIEWAAAHGAECVRVQPLLKLGRGTAIADQRLTTEQMDYLFLQLSDLANRYHARGVKCTLNESSRRFLLAHPCGAYVCNGAGCHRRMAKEIKKVVVREDGTILPEVTNLHPRFAIGNLRDGPLTDLIDRFFADGYQRFDALCRRLYNEVLPTWQSAVIPWDQLVAERSHASPNDETETNADNVCAMCAPMKFHSRPGSGSRQGAVH